jgi:hypothetical protein
MNILNERPGLVAIVSFVAGLFIGLVVLGWGLFPVQWTGAGPAQLAPADQANYLIALADSFAVRGNAETAQNSLRGWPEANEAICNLAATQTDPSSIANLNNLVVANGGQPCGAPAVGDTGLPAVGTTTEEAAEETSGSGRTFLLLLLLAGVVGGIFWLLQRRNTMVATDDDFETFEDTPTSAPETAGGDELNAIPLARFRTDYTHGRENYDDSFSIETDNQEFLGECGISIAESIGTDSPKNVTAFEVWLFDKNDIRTVTKVVMSDHAFFDEAIKAKLAPKGEPVLARENEVIVLETASLIINAEIVEMQYGESSLPPQSVFDNFTIEMSAWAKENTPEAEAPAAPGRADEMLEY